MRAPRGPPSFEGFPALGRKKGAFLAVAPYEMSALGVRLGLAAAAVLVVLPASAVAQQGAAVEGTELADTQGDVAYAADQLVIGFEEDVSKAEVSAAVAEVDGTITESLPAIDVSVVEVPQGDASEAIAALESAPAVEYVEPEVLLQATDVAPNDSLWSQQWGRSESRRRRPGRRRAVPRAPSSE